MKLKLNLKHKLMSKSVSMLAFGALLFSSLSACVSSNQTPPPVPIGNTSTPIKHLVVMFQENVSFDDYFGIYPNALNPQGKSDCTAAPNVSSLNDLQQCPEWLVLL